MVYSEISVLANDSDDIETYRNVNLEIVSYMRRQHVLSV